MMFTAVTKICALLGAGSLPMCAGYVAQPRNNQKDDDLCTETTIAILYEILVDLHVFSDTHRGGGMAGVSAAVCDVSTIGFFLPLANPINPWQPHAHRTSKR